MILFGHPTGNPNAHEAALAHYEAGRLEAYCLPWMPTRRQLAVLRRLPGLSGYSARLERRRFEPLAAAPLVEGRVSELRRMVRRLLSKNHSDERLAYEANDWLMRTMRRQCRRPSVAAVHAYEDCSLWQFGEAKRLGKACIYDMPIGYYPAWEQTLAALVKRYADWLPAGGPTSSRYVRPAQKRREMELADLVLAPSAFVRDTILEFSDKPVAMAPYGVDTTAWRPADSNDSPRASFSAEMTFLFAGQISVRKGIPFLLEAWQAANLTSARLDLVGSWQLAITKRKDLPAGVSWSGPVSQEQLKKRYHAADVFVLPTFFEGRALVVGEALACGLPVLTTDASGTSDLVDDSCGRLVRAGDFDELVAALRSFMVNRDRLPGLRLEARARAEKCTWEHYRHCVSSAVADLCGDRRPSATR